MRTVADVVDSWWFTLPMVKPLTMNDRPATTKGARMQRNEEVQRVREAAGWLAKHQRIPACNRVRVTLVYEPPHLNKVGKPMNPRRDPLNLVATLKPVQDGLVDAGVVPDDTAAYMDSPMPIIDAPRESQYGMISILVERLR